MCFKFLSTWPSPTRGNIYVKKCPLFEVSEVTKSKFHQMKKTVVRWVWNVVSVASKTAQWIFSKVTVLKSKYWEKWAMAWLCTQNLEKTSKRPTDFFLKLLLKLASRKENYIWAIDWWIKAKIKECNSATLEFPNLVSLHRIEKICVPHV